MAINGAGDGGENSSSFPLSGLQVSNSSAVPTSSITTPLNPGRFSSTTAGQPILDSVEHKITYSNLTTGTFKLLRFSNHLDMPERFRAYPRGRRFSVKADDGTMKVMDVGIPQRKIDACLKLPEPEKSEGLAELLSGLEASPGSVGADRFPDPPDRNKYNRYLNGDTAGMSETDLRAIMQWEHRGQYVANQVIETFVALVDQFSKTPEKLEAMLNNQPHFRIVTRDENGKSVMTLVLSLRDSESARSLGLESDLDKLGVKKIGDYALEFTKAKFSERNVVTASPEMKNRFNTNQVQLRLGPSLTPEDVTIGKIWRFHLSPTTVVLNHLTASQDSELVTTPVLYVHGGNVTGHHMIASNIWATQDDWSKRAKEYSAKNPSEQSWHGVPAECAPPSQAGAHFGLNETTSQSPTHREEEEESKDGS